ncbi:hypothetical protein Bbelb_277130 [Branchiostoma belcheri]|nr:hypothetical protein Bbelb_277130 [Branchiostoma belcheri]
MADKKSDEDRSTVREDRHVEEETEGLQKRVPIKAEWLKDEESRRKKGYRSSILGKLTTKAKSVNALKSQNDLQGTVWDTRRVSQTMPKHGLGQGIRVSQAMPSPQAQFGTRAECPRPCPGMVWDKAMATALNEHFVYLQVDLLYSVVDTRQDYPDPCVGLVDKQVLFLIDRLHPQITEWDKALMCPKLCPVRHGSGQSPHVPNCAQSQGTVWDTRRVSQIMPRHGLGQGTVRDMGHA